jgi:DnaJ-class molecular chaperone
MDIPLMTKCPQCHGEGRLPDGSTCLLCGGAGEYPVEVKDPDALGPPDGTEP